MHCICDRYYHIPPDVLKPTGGGEMNALTLIEELGATDLSSVRVLRWNSSLVPLMGE